MKAPFGVHVTEHAKRRAKARLREAGSDTDIKSLAGEARLFGIDWTAATGSVRRYLLRGRRFTERDRFCETLVYKDCVFVFSMATLITCWRLPHEFRGQAA